jgi:hypothetical protein
MFVQTFKADVIVFIGNVINGFTSQWSIIVNQFVDSDNRILWDQMKYIKITDKYIGAKSCFLSFRKMSNVALWQKAGLVKQ